MSPDRLPHRRRHESVGMLCLRVCWNAMLVCANKRVLVHYGLSFLYPLLAVEPHRYSIPSPGPREGTARVRGLGRCTETAGTSHRAPIPAIVGSSSLYSINQKSTRRPVVLLLPLSRRLLPFTVSLSFSLSLSLSRSPFLCLSVKQLSHRIVLGTKQ